VEPPSPQFRSPWGALRFASTDELRIGYYELGRGPEIVLLHGFPYDVNAYAEVAPRLAAAGHRAVVPFMRGCGPTTYRDKSVVRSAEQAALAADVLGLLDALEIERAVIAGFDWGARAACSFAALWPDRCAGLVAVGGYLIQDRTTASRPAHPDVESVLWYQYYFLTDRGRDGLSQYRRELARKLWHEWSPAWDVDDDVFDRSVDAFDNPDWVDTVVHNYRYRHGVVPGDPRYSDLSKRLARLPTIEVPAMSVFGSTQRGHASQRRGSESFGTISLQRVVDGAGHNVPQEQPAAFANAVLDLVRACNAKPDG